MRIGRTLAALAGSSMLALSLAGAARIPGAVASPRPQTPWWQPLADAAAGAIKQATSKQCTPVALREAYDAHVAPTLTKCRYAAVQAQFEGLFKPGGAPAETSNDADAGIIIAQSIPPGGSFPGPGTLTVTVSSGPALIASATPGAIVKSGCPPHCQVRPTPAATKTGKPPDTSGQGSNASDGPHDDESDTIVGWAILLIPVVGAGLLIRKLRSWLIGPMPVLTCELTPLRTEITTNGSPLVVEPSLAIDIAWATSAQRIEGLRIVAEGTI